MRSDWLANPPRIYYDNLSERREKSSCIRGGFYMNQLNETDAEKILSAVRIGLWRVEFEEGKPTRFYADA